VSRADVPLSEGLGRPGGDLLDGDAFTWSELLEPLGLRFAYRAHVWREADSNGLVYFTQQREHLVWDLIHPERFRQCTGRNGTRVPVGAGSVHLASNTRLHR
jgi:hypothetical protein